MSLLKLSEIARGPVEALHADVDLASGQLIEPVGVREQPLGQPHTADAGALAVPVAAFDEVADGHDGKEWGICPPSSMRDISLSSIFHVGGNIPCMGVKREKLRELVNESGKSARAVSLGAGLGATAIKDILSGKSRDPSADTITRIANQLGVAISDIFEDADVDAPAPDGAARKVQIVPRYLAVRYRVRAGHWYELDVDEPPRQTEMAVLPNPRYAQWPQWLEEVVGDSVNLKIPAGHFAHVVDAREMGYQPKDGDWVVVERHRDDGAVRERTIKQIAIDSAGKVKLWPRSTNPAFQTPVQMTNGSRSGESVEAYIVGLVIGAYDGDF